MLICGFIITGDEPKSVMVRGLGPTLTKAGVANPLADPVLELFNSARELVLSNDNWKDSQRPAIEATTIPPENDAEAAIVASLQPGAYTAVMRGKDGGVGVGLVEAYDVSQRARAKLANISTRGFVQTGQDVMIGGFILGGGGEGQLRRVVLRAIGPSLAQAGIANALPDPTLQLFNGSGTMISSNDDWKSDQRAELEETGIPPSDDREAAILATLPDGLYTAVVRDRSGGTGVGLVELYAIEEVSSAAGSAEAAAVESSNTGRAKH